MTPKIKHITLAMVTTAGAVVTFDPALFLTGAWSIDDYCLIMQMPIAEMLSNTVIELSEELIRMSLDSEWVKQHRRGVGQGDIFYVGTVPWLYVFMTNADVFTRAGMELAQSRCWPQAAVVRLTTDEKEPQCATL